MFHEPNVPQVPPVRVAEARSTRRVDASRPAPVSVPVSMVRGMEGVVYQGPAERSMVWPVGAVVSGVRVKVALAVSPAVLWAVTVCVPEVVVEEVQS